MPISWSKPDVAARDVRLRAYGLTSLASRVDPFLAWAAERGLVDEDAWFPLLIQLVDTTARDFALEVNKAPLSAGGQPFAWIPPWYLRPGPNLGPTRFVAAWVTADFFRVLSVDGSYVARHVDRFEFGLTDSPPPPEALRLLDNQVPLNEPPAAPFAGIDEADLVARWDEAVLGIVDDGIAFVQSRFLGRDGKPRIRAFWDQRVPVEVPSFAPKAPITHGIERDGDEILELMDRHRHAGLVDEDELYEAAGQGQTGGRARHGTHVLDVAAGLDPGSAAAPAIVAVQLPSQIAADASGALLAPHVFDGVRYIVDRADRHAASVTAGPGSPGPLPVVVNLSYGLLGGPHDGSSVLECALADLVRAREGDFDPTRPEDGSQPTQAARSYPLSIVIAAGNAAQDRCHATFVATPGETRTLKWRIPPDSRTSSYLEVWLGHAKPDATGAVVRLRLVPPVPTVGDVHEVGPGECAHLHDDTWSTNAPSSDRSLVASVSYISESPGGNAKGWPKSYYNDRDMILAAVAPTDGFDTDRAWAPAGVWTVELINSGDDDIEVHAWIRRNDSPFGSRTGGRQSWFEDEDYRVFDDEGRLVQHDDPASSTPVRRSTTLNGIATGRNALVVGAQRDKDRIAAPYTAHGPVVPAAAAAAPWRQGPDLLAPADRSAARRGVPGAGTRSGSVVFLNGTSVAAPSFARRMVEQFAGGKAKSTLDAYTAAAEALAVPVQAMNATVPSDVERQRSGLRRLTDPYWVARDEPLET
ncbi:MAG: hypothetical protein ACK5PW_07655 [Burkholderiales bacterium]|jgi:hypothetical protein